MKRIIAHRGNVYGPNEDKENSPDYILEALALGYEVEIDVWHVSGEFFLGHDGPEHKIDEIFLENDKFWCHAKNREALDAMILNKNIHCFWHQEDDYTLTSRGFIWAYPGKQSQGRAVCVMPEKTSSIDTSTFECICTDFCEKFK